MNGKSYQAYQTLPIDRETEVAEMLNIPPFNRADQAGIGRTQIWAATWR